MIFLKRTVVVLVCFCLLTAKPVKAFWPVFDFTEIAPVYSQVSTSINQLKELKEQLKELEATLKSIGKEVNNIAAFGKDLTNLVSDAASVVADASNLVNENLGTNIQIGEKAQNLADEVSKANGQIAGAITGSTNNILEGIEGVGNQIDKGGDLLQKAEGYTNKAGDIINKPKTDNQGNDEDKKAEKQKKSLKEKVGDVLNKENAEKASKALEEVNKATKGKYEDEILGVKKAVEKAGDVVGSKNDKKQEGNTDENNNDETPKQKKTLKETIKDTIKDNVTVKNVEKALDGLNEVTDGKYEQELGIVGKVTVNEIKDKEKNKTPNPSSDTTSEGDIEEEEEEEEVSIAEETAQIEAVKENISFALKESKAISVQFNDVLDISINTIYQNVEKNNTTMDKMISVIGKAENLTDSDKEVLTKEIDNFKQRQENLSINLVGIIEGIKDSYNKSYKSKIEDGYKNYEKVAIAYIRGDTEKEEFLFAGKKLENDINSINIVPDKGVINGVKIAINTLQKEIGDLSKKIKKIEEVNKKYNS